MRAAAFVTTTAAGIALAGAAVADPILECGVTIGPDGDVAGCLNRQLEVATAAMDQALSLARGAATKIDQVSGGQLAVLGLEAGQQAFEAYRDTECKTRAAFAAADPDPDRFRLACAIDLTRRRTDALLGIIGPQSD